MASRDKKVSLARKQSTASPVPPKEGAATSSETLTKSVVPKTETSSLDEAPKLAPIKTPKTIKAATIAKKIRKTAATKVIKKTIVLKAKSKTKLNQKLSKKLISNARNNVDVKKTLLKNVTRPKVVRKSKAQLAKQQNEFDGPPVLEPMCPIVKPKKRPKKLNADYEDSIASTIESIINEINRPTKKPKVLKKTKIESIPDNPKETLEDVMNDLNSLIKEEDVKNDVEPPSAVGKFEIKPKKSNVKCTKADLLKKIKKENIENKFIDDNNKVIEMLDLNVATRKNKIVRNRRHSIEKCPIGYSDANNQNVQIFSNLPRSISPKSKRSSRIRQSMELSSKRVSPYTTRSDSPARILRNGKHRKLKDINLLDGLDSEYRKRRRLCSDYSGSEISVSKSGYESDSSYSDLASLHGAENNETFEMTMKQDALKTAELNSSPIHNQENLNIKSLTNKLTNIIKRSLSTETASKGSADVEQKPTEQNFDSNSNLCDGDTNVDLQNTEDKDNQNVQSNSLIKLEDTIDYPDTEVSPSMKVPEKSIILDIMKQTFNDQQEKDTRTTRSSAKKNTNAEEYDISITPLQFYTSAPSDEVQNENMKEPAINEEQKEPIINEEIKEPAINEETKDYVANETTINEEYKNEPFITEAPILEETIPPTTDEAISHVEETTTERKNEAMCEEDVTENNQEKVTEIIETPESLLIKETIFQALGLTSLKAVEEARMKNKEKLVPKQDNYTGTLKTVIKLNRYEKKRGKHPLKMTLQKTKKGAKDNENDLVKTEEDNNKTTKEGVSSWKSHGGQSSDTAGALRKSHYSNRSNMDGSSEHTSDGDTAATEEGPGKLLVIPEKASSFSIHPERLCKDECSYCFGKFGLFDTPCHIAQMKSVERQDRILSCEKHLTRDSCLCDACYRHVDRKSNTPSYTNNKSSKRNNLVAPAPRQNHCHVLSCKNVATNILRRKWIIKMRKNVCQVINIDLDNPGLHSIPICEEHYTALEHLMVCAMCKRRLARNHIHYLGAESNDLNAALNEMGIPVKLHDKPVVCKMCKYFAALILKTPDERPENGVVFYKEYKRRLLHFNDVEHLDDTEAEEPIPVPANEKCDKEQLKRKKKVSKSNDEPPVLEPQVDVESPTNDQNPVPSGESRSESPTDYMVDYNTLIPNIAMECGSDAEIAKKELTKKPILLKKIPRPESVKEAVEISKTMKLKNKSDIAVQRLGSNPSISVRQLFHGEEDLPLQGNIEFHNVKERTPEGWEKCTSIIQYDADTKQLWQELQKPYGNQSSFLRHLILLEKYFRNGDLILSPTASHHSMNYSESVQNRLRAYDNTPTSSGPIQPLSMIPFNKPQKSSSGIITSKDNSQTVAMLNTANIPKNTPITISQLANPNYLVTTANKQKSAGLPPGLMPLQPGTNRPVAPLIRVPQSQKIKFPITKNWRPNLIPIDPSKKIEKKPGLVQVISSGKPYHITVEDYKKMCAIKRTFDLKQKKLQEVHKTKSELQKPINSGQSLLKSIVPRKGLMISKTSTLTSPKNDHNSTECEREESSLEKLDKQVEKLGSILSSDSKSVMILPKIPKSLTVIPQTVTRKPSRPSSPTLQITPKVKVSTKS